MNDDFEEQGVSGGYGAPEQKRETSPASVAGEPQIDPARKALVEDWTRKVRDAKKHFEKDFKRIQECQYLARHGASKQWTASGKYVNPIIPRHIDTSVSELYAKNPKPQVQRRKRLIFQLWDGTSEMAMMAAQNAPLGDMQAQAVLEEIQAAKTEMKQLDDMAKTLEIVDTYYMSEQDVNFKAMLKKTLRRSKVAGVAYIKQDFQRIMGEAKPAPDKIAKIDDIRSKIEEAERITAMGQSGQLVEDSPEVERLRLILKDLEQPESILVREGPVVSALKATQVIVDPACYDLKTFAGANWIAVEYDMHPSAVSQTYSVDITGGFTRYGKGAEADRLAKVWEIWDKTAQQVLTVADGYCDFLREPAEPEIRVDGFWTTRALVLSDGECDDEDEPSLYPLSDVWRMRPAQEAYNIAREGIREHRVAARPYYVTAKGVIEEQDRAKLGVRAAHEVVELNVAASEQFDVNRLIQPGPTSPIDPNLYEVEGSFTDIQRAVGSQEANIGGLSGATATESSIAEASRTSSVNDAVDELDEFLSQLARDRGQIYLQQLQRPTVLEIVGPGAVWPEAPMTREEASKDLMLDIKAGSSGRPNKAAELANLERAMPFVVQIPSINPKPLADKYLALLDIDVDEATAEGMPSIMAINSALARQAGPGAQPTGDPATDPNAQGAAGAQNGPQAAGGNEGPQPEFPAAPV